MKLANLYGKPEIFYTIQGEGKNMGMPSVFVRLSLCNLYCVWCDTDYTWNWEGTKYEHHNDAKAGYQKFSKADYIVKMKVAELLQEVTQYPCKNIVITGGEPMVQHKELLPFLSQLKSEDAGYHTEMETNGTLIPTSDLDALMNQYNVSVKLSNSRVKKEIRIIPDAIRFFAASPKAVFKFVVDTPEDMLEVKELIETYNIPANRVYLMPQGTTEAMLHEKQQWVVELCKEFGFNYTDRIHIHIYGAKRGV